jgi:hypothetical protein
MPIEAIAQATREPFETLTAAEGATLEAIVARLIPTDANGARRRGSSRRALHRSRARRIPQLLSRRLSQPGLAGVDPYARTAKGCAVHSAVRAGSGCRVDRHGRQRGKGFAGAALFFNVVARAHTIQGTFCDPFYGGNANFVGWDLLGYPGIRLTASRQRSADGRLAGAHTHVGLRLLDVFAGRSPMPVNLKPTDVVVVGLGAAAAWRYCPSRRPASR